MRKGILAIAAAGSVFALTAAGASSLSVTSGPVPAGGSTTTTNCTASAVVSYTATAADPSLISSIDVTPTISGTGCASMPALVKVTWTDNADPAVSTTAWGYQDSGLTASTKQSFDTLYTTAAAAVAGTGTTVTLPAVADFNAPTTKITIAGSFA